MNKNVSSLLRTTALLSVFLVGASIADAQQPAPITFDCADSEMSCNLTWPLKSELREKGVYVNMFEYYPGARPSLDPNLQPWFNIQYPNWQSGPSYQWEHQYVRNQVRNRFSDPNATSHYSLDNPRYSPEITVQCNADGSKSVNFDYNNLRNIKQRDNWTAANYNGETLMATLTDSPTAFAYTHKVKVLNRDLRNSPIIAREKSGKVDNEYRDFWHKPWRIEGSVLAGTRLADHNVGYSYTGFSGGGSFPNHPSLEINHTLTGNEVTFAIHRIGWQNILGQIFGSSRDLHAAYFNLKIPEYTCTPSVNFSFNVEPQQVVVEAGEVFSVRANVNQSAYGSWNSSPPGGFYSRTYNEYPIFGIFRSDNNAPIETFSNNPVGTNMRLAQNYLRETIYTPISQFFDSLGVPVNFETLWTSGPDGGASQSTEIDWYFDDEFAIQAPLLPNGIDSQTLTYNVRTKLMRIDSLEKVIGGTVEPFDTIWGNFKGDADSSINPGFLPANRARSGSALLTVTVVRPQAPGIPLSVECNVGDSRQTFTARINYPAPSSSDPVGIPATRTIFATSNCGNQDEDNPNQWIATDAIGGNIVDQIPYLAGATVTVTTSVNPALQTNQLQLFNNVDGVSRTSSPQITTLESSLTLAPISEGGDIEDIKFNLNLTRTLPQATLFVTNGTAVAGGGWAPGSTATVNWAGVRAESCVGNWDTNTVLSDAGTIPSVTVPGDGVLEIICAQETITPIPVDEPDVAEQDQ